MTTYVRTQTYKLITTGKCDLPIDWDDVVKRISNNPDFSYALQRALDDEPLLLHLMVHATAEKLCRAFIETYED